MNDSQNIQRDTPLRRCSTFVWGMALFSVFGLASVLAYWSIGNSQTAYSIAAEERGKVTKEVAETQAGLIAAKTADQKIIPALNLKPKRTKVLVPGTPAHDKANAVPATPVNPANPAATEGASLNGQKIFRAKSCQSCHGDDGKSPIAPIYPVIAGKEASYLTAKMLDIKSEKYVTDLTPLMLTTISTCSEAEIKAMSEWLSTVK